MPPFSGPPRVLDEAVEVDVFLHMPTRKAERLRMEFLSFRERG